MIEVAGKARRLEFSRIGSGLWLPIDSPTDAALQDTGRRTDAFTHSPSKAKALGASTSRKIAALTGPGAFFC
jgi:hypothetical protein